MKLKKTKNIFCSIIVIASLLASLGTFAVNDTRTICVVEEEGQPPCSLSYDPHENIWVKSNQELLDLADAEGWVGTGTTEDPIIIEGYSFFDTEMQPIRFWDTSIHWIFRNNYVTTSREWCGFWVDSVSNGIIYNNTFDACHSGTFLDEVQGMIIEQNTFINGRGYGVECYGPVSDMIIKSNDIHSNDIDAIVIMSESSNVSILNNHIHDGIYDAIDVQMGDDFLIRGNIISSMRYGIRLAGVVSGCTIDANTVCDIRNSGVYCRGDGNSITNNLLRDLGRNGIILDEDDGEFPADNSISGNTFINCSDNSIKIEAGSSANSIENNDFFESGADCHICDDGASTTIADNFYDTWCSPDADSDGVVDTPFPVIGAAGNADLTPKAEPVNSIPEDYSYSPMTPISGGDTIPLMELALIGGIGTIAIVIIAVFAKRR